MATIVRYLRRSSSGGNGTTNTDSGANAAFASMSAAMSSMSADSSSWTTSDDVVLYCLQGSGGSADTYTTGATYAFNAWAVNPVSLTVQGCYPTGSEEMPTIAALDTSRYRIKLNQAWQSVGFSNFAFNAYFKNLQFDTAGGNRGTFINKPNSGIILVVDGCLWRSGGGANGDADMVNCTIVSGSTGKIIYVNNILYDAGTGTVGVGIGVGYVPSFQGVLKWMNNTFHASGLHAFNPYYHTRHFYNNLAADHYTSDYLNTTPTNYTATSNLSKSASGTYWTQNTSTWWTSTTEGSEDYTLSVDSGAIGVGVDKSADPDYPYNWDFFLNTRDSTWDAGAIAFIPSDPTSSFIINFQNRWKKNPVFVR